MNDEMIKNSFKQNEITSVDVKSKVLESLHANKKHAPQRYVRLKAATALLIAVLTLASVFTTYAAAQFVTVTVFGSGSDNLYQVKFNIKPKSVPDGLKNELAEYSISNGIKTGDMIYQPGKEFSSQLEVENYLGVNLLHNSSIDETKSVRLTTIAGMLGVERVMLYSSNKIAGTDKQMMYEIKFSLLDLPLGNTITYGNLNDNDRKVTNSFTYISPVNGLTAEMVTTSSTDSGLYTAYAYLVYDDVAYALSMFYYDDATDANTKLLCDVIDSYEVAE